MQRGIAWRSILAGCALIAFPSGKAGWTQERPTVEQIIEGIRRTEQMFFDNSSLHIRYERTKSEDVTPNRYSGAFLLAEWSLAYHGSNWFTEQRFTQPTKTDTLWVPAEPKTQVVKDRVLVEWTQYGNSAVVDQFNLGWNFFGGLLYTRNLSLDVPAHVAKSNGANIAAIRKDRPDDAGLPFLPAFLEDNQARYHVLSEPEVVNGVPCWIVEWPGMDRFWVDPKRGFAIPRRAYCWSPGKPLRYEFLNLDYREVKPGLWLPFMQVENTYAKIHAEEESLWGKVTGRTEYRLHSVAFDTVSESLFDIRLPPGTRVVDMVRKFKYSVSGDKDTDPFTAEISEARRQLPASRPTRVLWWLFLASVGVSAVVVAAWLYRRRSAG
jgi:hypothetical protein